MTSTSDPAQPPKPRRPLLGGGEKLSTETSWGKVPPKPSAPAHTASEMHQVLRPQAADLRKRLAAMPAELRVGHVVVEATLWPNDLASSHYPEKVLSACGLYQVGTRHAKELYRTAMKERPDEPTKSLILAGDDKAVGRFLSLLEASPASDIDPYWDELRRFSRLRMGDRESVIRGKPLSTGDGELHAWEAVLTLVGRDAIQQKRFADEAFEKFVLFIKRIYGEVQTSYRREVGGLLFVPVSLTVESVEQAPAFNLLRVIRPMPTLRSIGDDGFRVSKRTPPAAPPKGMATITQSRMAVIDGGVDLTLPALSPYVRQIHLTTEAPLDSCVKHGTLVTATALYGYTDGGLLRRPVAPIDHYRVLPPPAAELSDNRAYWLLDRVLEAVTGKGYKVVNLSIGPLRSVEDDCEPDRWTTTLDSLAAEEGVAIVCAAGNNGGDDANRIQVPADMVNGVAVGACLHRGRGAPIQKARYSAVGPGRFGQRVSPTGVGFGGSLDAEPFCGLGPHGVLLETQGTSFAAPVVTHGLAELEALLGPKRGGAHALRAFAAHFAELNPRQSKKRYGHGRIPESFVDLWECAPNEVTVLYQTELARGDKTAMYLPMPEGLHAEGQVEIRWTLCYLSEVDPHDAADYTKSGFEVYFRPNYNMRHVFDDSTKESIGPFDIVIQEDELAALSRARTVRWSDTPAAHGSRQFRTEGALREAGKWETLSQGTYEMECGELFKPRIDLNHLARGEGQLLKASGVDDLPLSLLVTIRARGVGDLYDRARQAFQTLVPLVQHADVTIQLAS